MGRYSTSSATRRRVLYAVAAGAAGGLLPCAYARTARAAAAGVGADATGSADEGGALIRTRIPRSGETVVAIGMGTWITFDVGPHAHERRQRAAVLAEFFAGGGQLIDSSPMYGSAEAVLGDLLPLEPGAARLFAATKVWTPGRALGARQMELSRALWRLPRFDLLQVHNLVDWRTHLETLREWRAAGRVRYIGITTSHGRRHDELEIAMRSGDVDFVQLTYNIAHREAETRLLPLAADLGVAVIANRPFDGGSLFDQVRRVPLPAWAADIDCANWAQFFLKFVVSHPAMGIAIPATSQPGHMVENIGAARGRLPEPAMRRRMAAFFDGL